MTKSVLAVARQLMRRRQFGSAISLLQQYYEYYKGTFEYYLMLGTSYLYVGDVGSASRNYDEARKIKLENSELYLGQAAIFLRRGETDRAIQYYLDIQNFDPNNVTVREAMEFIRGKGDYKTICEWTESGRIMRFYPPLGMNPDIIRNSILCGLVLGACISAGILIGGKFLHGGERAAAPRTAAENAVSKTFQRLELTEDEARNAQDLSLSDGEVHFQLSGTEIRRSYDSAIEFVKAGRDNAARVEINRIRSSNAVPSIKKKAEDLQVTLKVPTVDSLKDNYSYQTVAEDPLLYRGCYVVWDGRLANVESRDDGSVRCTLLVGYDTKKTILGMVPVLFKEAPSPQLDTEKPVRILGVVGEDAGGTVTLTVCSSFQPLKGDSLPEWRPAK